ncbi:XRE family transcriptional regulator [Paenibacillus sp. E194]|jgi:transcriptional regulator with XRE-family HTH domain|uniref:XRE family transcriptional regulator n=3 Tax=Paenibacillus TaxID=44249 RepID=S9UAY8_PAEAL|nr:MULTISPECIES: helix-turn-helix transcriptional regulator [Paenibacillus]EPY07595.1 XRE family transcriptional regulator [Paenibacillus alvei TS-15]KJB84861.1 XRE family transcriptional regulator [Paenibacillus sp. E194]MCM3289848.1 helix-turn-helix domain-containing protein [Paenibacillus sp. MER 180]OBY79687.1 transcriptional regulator [Paenibacillus sp. KS1]TQR46798.1 XRE family transcriptional regulator [Paenibacillus sp. SDF0028]
MTFGERLRNLRTARNMSQEQVARHIGLTRSAYSHYEINNRQPVYTTLLKLAVLFDVSVDYLINDNSYLESRETNQLLQLWHGLDADSRQQTLQLMRQSLYSKR